MTIHRSHRNLTCWKPLAWVATAIASSAPCAAQTQLFSDTIHRLIPDGYSNKPLVIGDFTGDGKQDLVLGKRLFENEGGYFREAACGLPPSHSFPWLVYVAADLDGDGDLDLLAAGYDDDEVWINTGGCFQLAQVLGGFYFLEQTEAAALGDLDGDGDIDAILSDRADDDTFGAHGGAFVYRNDGTGAFSADTAAIPVQMGDDPVALALGDVDGDQDPDLLIVNASSDFYTTHPRLLLNDGDGTFTDASGQLPASSVSSSSAAIADLDGDGDVDILVGAAVLWLNTGTGYFLDASSTLPPMPTGAREATVGDVDADGDIDFCVSSFVGEDALLQNDGTGSFSIAAGALPMTSERTEAIRWIAADADGDIDLVVTGSNGPHLLFNDGTATFQEVLPLLPTQGELASAVATGDVDSDGDQDLLFGNLGQNRLYVNDGSGAMADATAQLPADSLWTTAVALADMDADGDLDALFGNGFGGSEVDVLALNDGTGNFIAQPSMWAPPADTTQALAAVDVDGDGDIDVFIGNRFDPDRLYLNDGVGNLTEIPGKWPAAVITTFSATFADFDGDDDLDAVLGSYGPRLFLNDGSGTFGEVGGAFTPVSSECPEVLAGDVDADGDQDVIWTEGSGGSPKTIHLERNDGAGGFTSAPAQTPALGVTVRAADLTDVDADGDLDLMACMGDSTSWMLVNDGTGTFSASLVPAPPMFASQIRLADVDDDLDLDLVCAQDFEGSRILVNTERHLAWSTPPEIGSTVGFKLWGTPGQAWTLLGSRASAYVPQGAIGVLRIDRSLVFHTAHGVYDAQGRSRTSYALPNDPSLYGISYYWQALSTNPRRLTNLEITTLLSL